MAILADDVAINRTALLSARTRFSHSGADLRNQAVERILEENLAAAASALSEIEIDQIVGFAGHAPLLKPDDVSAGIRNLRKKGRIIERHAGGRITYTLSDEAKTASSQTIANSRKELEDVIIDLFGIDEANEYGQSFLNLLCLVFHRLGNVYVQVMGKSNTEPFVKHELLIRTIEDVHAKAPIRDPDAFKRGVNRFFRESNPRFDSIKWNMTQSYFP